MRPRAKLLRAVLAAICLTAIVPVASASAKQAVTVGRGGAVVSDSTTATDAA